MKKIIFASLVVLATACNTDKKTTSEWFRDGNLSISTLTPETGQDLQLRYKSEANDINEAVYYVIVDQNTYANDLNLSKTDSVYLKTIKIPDSATAIAFSFKINDKEDTNQSRGYVYKLYDTNNREIPGSTLSALNFKSGIGSYIAEIKFQPDSAAAELKRAFTENPSSKTEFIPAYFGFINRSDKDLANELIREYLAQFSQKNKLSEDDYQNLSELYRASRNNSANDSIRKLATAAYPNGKIAIEDKYNALIQLDGVEEKERKLAEIKDSSATKSSLRIYLEQQIAQGYLDQGNVEKFEEYTSKIKDKTILSNMYNNTAWELAQDEKNMDFAAMLSKRSLDMTHDLKKSMDNKPDSWSPSQYSNILDINLRQYSDTYAYILYKQRKITEAIKYQEEALGDEKNSEMNERYVMYLSEAKDYDKVINTSEKYIKQNKATTKIKEYYKDAYQKNGKGIDGFDNKLAQLEKTGKEKSLTDLKSMMIDEAAPQFKLMNLNGKEVALADFKGKTVVLDFWATWCGPCKMSFPGMQMALNKYEEDPNVEFLFVDTWESTAGDKRKNSVSDFIKKNKYSFNLLMDTPVEEGSNEYSVVSDYGVDGIPTKFILGPDGRIKFKTVGFEGSSEKLAQEIEMMINLAKS